MYCTCATITRFSLQTAFDIHKARILKKNMRLEKAFLDFKKGVKSIQTVGYNGARTVHMIIMPKTLCPKKLYYLVFCMSHKTFDLKKNEK